jgi:hypothetical protein
MLDKALKNHFLKIKMLKNVVVDYCGEPLYVSFFDDDKWYSFEILNTMYGCTEFDDDWSNEDIANFWVNNVVSKLKELIGEKFDYCTFYYNYL